MPGRSAAVAAAVAVGGYLLGSISFARIVGRFVAPGTRFRTTSLSWGEEQRIEMENVSATTIGEIGGPALGCLTGSFDILKATVPVALLRRALPVGGYDVVCAAAVMAGHNYPLYHRFRGGRGTSTLLGALVVLDPLSIPVTIGSGYVIGLYGFKDVLLAHHAGWIVLLPAWFALRRRWSLFLYGLVVNVLRWSVSIPEVKQWWHYRRSGELRTEEFHEAIEKTHIGYIHGVLRRRGWLTYDYMRDEDGRRRRTPKPPRLDR
jgi:glycerol-3-phosphate acyltransferase PlsY